MRLTHRGVLGLFLLMLSSPYLLWSQSQMTTGTIEGTVVDETGAVVSGATVTLTHVATGSSRTLSTDASGRYTAPLLSVGNYQITAQLTGFTTVKRTGILVVLGQTQTVDITLKLASVETTVEVTEAAPLVETSKSETSTSIDSNQVSSLPLNGRKFFDLAFLTPGVYQESEDRVASTAISTSTGLTSTSPSLAASVAASARPPPTW
jgi:Carboxypeptidase regulatory-like domain